MINNSDILIQDKNKISQINNLRNKIFKRNKIIIIRNAIKKEIIKNILRYSKKNMKKPKFQKVELNCKNLFIFNKNNKKSKVKGYYKKFLILPWNDLNFFKACRFYFKLKFKVDKVCSPLMKKKFFDKNLFSTLQIMEYPKKRGYLSRHIDSNLRDICILQIATNNHYSKNKDGSLVVIKNGKEIALNTISKNGDIVIFSSKLQHRVSKSKNSNRMSIILATDKLN